MIRLSVNMVLIKSMSLHRSTIPPSKNIDNKWFHSIMQSASGFAFTMCEVEECGDRNTYQILLPIRVFNLLVNRYISHTRDIEGIFLHEI